MNDTLDLLIIGGGPAGMAAALVAGRARLRTVVINAESPRNAVAHASHGFLTRDGAHAMELLAIAKRQLEPYTTVIYTAGWVAGVEKTADGFTVRDAQGRSWTAHRLVIATGYRDELKRTGVPDVEAVYGESVFACPFCDGFENADRRIAILGSMSLDHMVPMIRVWSEDIAVFTNGVALEHELRERLEGAGVRVEEARIARLDHDDGQLLAVELEGGLRVERDTGFLSGLYAVPSTTFAGELGVPTKSHPWGMEIYAADDFGKTAVERVYLVGDARSGFGGIAQAAYQGSICAQHIVADVAMERWRSLVSPGVSR